MQPKRTKAEPLRTVSADLSERLWPRTQKSATCWLWQGAVSGDGYGTLTFQRKMLATHRVAWRLVSDQPIPADRVIGHTCDVKRCVRNDDEGIYVVAGVAYERRGHLWLATNDANMADMAEKNRLTKGLPKDWAPVVTGPARGDANGSRLHPDRLMRGEQVNTCQLTSAQVIEIRQRYVRGVTTARSLAAEYGVHRNTVALIVAGRTWKHLL